MWRPQGDSKTPRTKLMNHQRPPKTMKDQVNQRVNSLLDFTKLPFMVFHGLSWPVDGPDLAPKISFLRLSFC